MLYKRGKTWWYKWYVGDKMRRKSLETTEADKARSLARILDLSRERVLACEQAHRIVDEIFARESFLLIEDSWDEYCRLVEASGKKPSADMMKRRRLYWSRFTDFVVDQAKVTNVASITREHAVAFVASLNKTGRKGKTRKLIISYVAGVWNMLAVAIYAPKIFEGLLPDTSDSEIRLAFTVDEERRILDAARDMFGGKWFLASYISRYTGLRYSDVRSLEWEEFDDKWILRHTPKKTRAHGIKIILPIVEPLLSILKDARAHARSPFVLPDHVALPEYGWQSETFTEVMAAAGVDTSNHTFHSWRHTFRTRLAEAGVSDDLAKRLGGWTQDRTSLGYDHAERIAEMRDAIGRTAQ